MKLRVNGLPAPQGSKRPVRLGSGPTARMGMVESSKAVGPWREAVRGEVARYGQLGAWLDAKAGGKPVAAHLVFRLPRPRNHYGTGRNIAQLLPSAPRLPALRPDLDKLTRSTLDGLALGGALADDGQVVQIMASKIYASAGEVPGCDIQLEVMQGA